MTQTEPQHADWCHTVIGCIEPDHCTCDVKWQIQESADAGTEKP